MAVVVNSILFFMSGCNVSWANTVFASFAIVFARVFLRHQPTASTNCSIFFILMMDDTHNKNRNFNCKGLCIKGCSLQEKAEKNIMIDIHDYILTILVSSNHFLSIKSRADNPVTQVLYFTVLNTRINKIWSDIFCHDHFSLSFILYQVYTKYIPNHITNWKLKNHIPTHIPNLN